MNQLQQTITSLEVAEMIGKNHWDLLRDIRRYVAQFNGSNLASVDFFEESSYIDSKGEERPCFNVSKKGCEFIAHKLTGIKGTEFTARYINRFHDMEAMLKNTEIVAEKKSPIQLLELELAALKEVDQKVDAVNDDLQRFKLDMPILGLECDRITAAVRRQGVHCLGGKEAPAYKDRSLRGKVYHDIYQELKRQFGVESYKAIKRGQADLAVGIVEAYTLPIVLAGQVEAANEQMELGPDAA